MVLCKFCFMVVGGVVLVFGGGYVIYSLMVVQVQGMLVQVLLNIQVQMLLVFLMVLDDFGLMLWEMLNNMCDGVYCWDGSGFYNQGVVNGYDGFGQCYLYVFFSYGCDDQVVILLFDSFGFV